MFENGILHTRTLSYVTGYLIQHPYIYLVTRSYRC